MKSKSFKKMPLTEKIPTVVGYILSYGIMFGLLLGLAFVIYKIIGLFF